MRRGLQVVPRARAEVGADRAGEARPGAVCRNLKRQGRIQAHVEAERREPARQRGRWALSFQGPFSVTVGCWNCNSRGLGEGAGGAVPVDAHPIKSPSEARHVSKRIFIRTSYLRDPTVFVSPKTRSNKNMARPCRLEGASQAVRPASLSRVTPCHFSASPFQPLNDPKLSDSGVRRGTCMLVGKAVMEAGAVTHGAVRCGAWLGDGWIKD